ncbi:ATP-grasp domain-containing protein [bacterium]|nr:ATP-grasp domain-containing protein [bacterium]
MKNIVFYSPHFGENTLKFVKHLKNYGFNVIGLGQDSYEFAKSLNCFNEFFRVEDATDQNQLEAAITEISKNRKIDKLLNIQENFQLLISRIREKFGIDGILTETAQKFRDKALMKQVLKENGILCANYQKAESKEQAREFVLSNSFPFIIKPLKGAGCEDTFLVWNNEQFEDILNTLNITMNSPMILEEFIQGEEGSFDTFTINGNISFYSMTTYHPPLLKAMQNAWIQPIYMFDKDLDELHKDVIETGKNTIKALGLDTSMTHMEWFRRQKDGKIYVGEIAARPPGGPIIDVHNFGHDTDLFAEWGNVMVNKKFDLYLHRKHNVGSACLRAQGDGKEIKEISGVDVVQKELGHLICGIHIPTIGSPKVDSYVGEGLIFCRGENWNDVFQSLIWATETIKIHC